MALRHKSSKIIRLISFTVVFLALLFIAKIFFDNIHEIPLEKICFDYKYLFLAIAFVFINTLYFGWLWYLILRLLGEKPVFIHILRVYLYSSIVRYLPGKVWNVLGRIHWGRKIGLSEKKVILSSILENMFLIIGSAFTSFYALKLFLSTTYFYFLFLFVALLFILLHPRILEFAINKIGKKWISNKVSLQFSYLHILLMTFLFTILQILAGICFFFFLMSFYKLKYTDLPDFISYNSASWLIGHLSIITPGGLGIREGVFVFVFKNIVPVSIAVMSAVLIRIFSIFAELIPAAILFCFDKGAWKNILELKNLLNVNKDNINERKA